MALDAHQLVDGLDHVHRDADGAGLVCDGAGDRLADPPGCIGGELEALGVVELLNCADEAQVAFLDEVEEEHAAAHIALGDGDHQAQVGLDEGVLGVPAHLLDTAQAALLLAIELDAVGLCLLKLRGGGQAGLDLHGEVDFLCCGEQVDLADLLQVHAHGIPREHGDAGGLGAGAARLSALLARGCLAGLLEQVLGLGTCLELVFGDALHDVLVGHGGVGVVFYSRAGGCGIVDFDAIGAEIVHNGVELLGVELLVCQGALDGAPARLLPRILDQLVNLLDDLWLEHTGSCLGCLLLAGVVSCGHVLPFSFGPGYSREPRRSSTSCR